MSKFYLKLPIIFWNVVIMISDLYETNPLTAPKTAEFSA
jgi:hypothetical protein